jgi:uncharacterized membrane protein
MLDQRPDSRYDSTVTLYELLKIIHILAVVVGIGTVMLNGVYGAKAKAAGPNGGAAIGKANFEVSAIAEYFIYLIPVPGILMLLVEPDFWEWSQTWVWLSIVLYVVALGISHAVQIPSAKRMNELMASGPPNDETAALEKKLAGGGMALNLLAVVIIVLMVTKPGV